MKSAINQLRSKVMKAAWTIFRKGDAATWSIACKKAWAWGKKKIVVEDSIEIASRATRETDKAYGVRVALDNHIVEQTIYRLVWFPKSMLRNGCAQKWLVDRKFDEVLGTIGSQFTNSTSVYFA